MFLAVCICKENKSSVVVCRKRIVLDLERNLVSFVYGHCCSCVEKKSSFFVFDEKDLFFFHRMIFCMCLFFVYLVVLVGTGRLLIVIKNLCMYLNKFWLSCLDHLCHIFLFLLFLFFLVLFFEILEFFSFRFGFSFFV